MISYQKSPAVLHLKEDNQKQGFKAIIRKGKKKQWKNPKHPRLLNSKGREMKGTNENVSFAFTIPQIVAF